jgi:tetratricopeptide (TPR) repeat protein
MRAGLLDLPFVEERDPAAVRRAVLDYLHYATNYLLICDNVDSPQTFGASWPNRSRLGGQVLLTSRSPDIRRLGAVVVDLTKLSDADAAAYLLRCHPAGSSAERQALAELSQELDGLPLALAQAAAFLAEHQSCYADYLRQYRKQRLSLLEQAIPQDYPSSVATTWAMNLEQVHRTCGASLDLLQLCALLHPGGIPEELFANPVVELGDALRAALTGTSQEDGDALALDRLLKPLLGYALVQRDREKHLLFIHRLVQQAVLYRMPESSLKSRAHALLVQLDSVFPEPQFRNWGQCRRLLPQVIAMAGHIQRFCITSLAAGHLLHKAGHFLNDQGEYAEASQLCQRALAIRQEVLGDQHLDVAHSLKGLGVVLKNQGKLAEAEALFRRALTIREQALGSEHPDVADSLNYLGRLLKNQGRQGDAEQLHRRALMVVENAIGSEHVEVAHCLSNLVAVLRKQGKLTEAEALGRRALFILERALDDKHPNIAHGLHDLGLLLWEQGRFKEAEPLYRRALAIREQVLPSGHPRIDFLRRKLEELMPTADRSG